MRRVCKVVYLARCWQHYLALVIQDYLIRLRRFLLGVGNIASVMQDYLIRICFLLSNNFRGYQFVCF